MGTPPPFGNTKTSTKMFGLYRKGRADTLLFSAHSQQDKTNGVILHDAPLRTYWRPLLFQTKDDMLLYLATNKVEDYEVRKPNLSKTTCPSPRSLLNKISP